MKSKTRTMTWRNRASLQLGTTAPLLLGMILSLVACGGSNSVPGCSVNGTYYPNGNDPNDPGQCVCPPIGHCTITATTTRAITAGKSQTATLLANGQVLVVGGLNGNDAPLASAELHDPATGISTATGRMTAARYNHTATLLANGQVLVAGGLNGGDAPLASAELYDPATGVFSATANMTAARYNHTARLLADGQVLLTGGQDSSGTTLNTAELYDPVAQTFTALTAREVIGQFQKSKWKFRNPE